MQHACHFDTIVFNTCTSFLSVAPEHLDSGESDAALRDYVETHGLALSHTVAEILSGLDLAADTSSHRQACYINSPDAAPFTDGFFPCKLAGYLGDLVTAHKAGEIDAAADEFTCIVIERVSGDELALHSIEYADFTDA